MGKWRLGGHPTPNRRRRHRKARHRPSIIGSCLTECHRSVRRALSELKRVFPRKAREKSARLDAFWEFFYAPRLSASRMRSESVVVIFSSSVSTSDGGRTRGCDPSLRPLRSAISRERRSEFKGLARRGWHRDISCWKTRSFVCSDRRSALIDLRNPGGPSSSILFPSDFLPTDKTRSCPVRQSLSFSLYYLHGSFPWSSLIETRFSSKERIAHWYSHG